MSAPAFLIVAFIVSILAAIIAGLIAALNRAELTVIAPWCAGTFVVLLGLSMTAYQFVQ
ncbi:hypothetical protein [Actinoplanes awajinensis]|uniref:hypothetical protein n=1 Tax=Actinoplanes awajinensis TaxID=135946 RepID=UPI000AEFD14B|nr:hypothetical protein [Actinoplanes awajinensis]